MSGHSKWSTIKHKKAKTDSSGQNQDQSVGAVVETGSDAESDVGDGDGENGDTKG